MVKPDKTPYSLHHIRSVMASYEPLPQIIDVVLLDENAVNPLVEGPHFHHPTIPTSTAGIVRRLLYTSHFLSTWNSRLFEFAAYLFLARLYPHTLLPASLYALIRAASAAIFSPWLGSYVDNGNRLKVVRLSIGKHLLHS